MNTLIVTVWINSVLVFNQEIPMEDSLKCVRTALAIQEHLETIDNAHYFANCVSEEDWNE